MLTFIYFICLVSSTSVAADAEPKAPNDHFQLIENHSQLPQPAQATDLHHVDPLRAYPAAQYIVRGVMVMEDNAVAVVYSPRKTWHKLQVQSHIGQEQAVIKQITTQGIQIDSQGTLLWLPILQ